VDGWLRLASWSRWFRFEPAQEGGKSEGGGSGYKLSVLVHRKELEEAARGIGVTGEELIEASKCRAAEMKDWYICPLAFAAGDELVLNSALLKRLAPLFEELNSS